MIFHSGIWNLRCVSVLFSEPKIPHTAGRWTTPATPRRFSALQRAENSSIELREQPPCLRSPFQCSSASRKFLTSRRAAVGEVTSAFQCSSASRKFLTFSFRYSSACRWCFSALQRAENSSSWTRFVWRRSGIVFQCSSASRKFLTSLFQTLYPRLEACFSALQRAENSSQTETVDAPKRRECFSALQRAENSSACIAGAGRQCATVFQCSSASRKFLTTGNRSSTAIPSRVSVLFSEPKIPHMHAVEGDPEDFRRGFSALQRAENSSIECA